MLDLCGKEVEELRSSKGKEQQGEEKEEAIPPLWIVNMKKLEEAPHQLDSGTV